jgi:hypothetical protein
MRKAALLSIMLLAACRAESHEGGAPGAEEAVTPPAEAAPGVILLGDGLAVPSGAGYIAFDTAASDAIASLAPVLGGPGEIVRNDECGAGPMEMTDFDEGLVVSFQDGKFVGWFLDGERDSLAIATEKGVTIGSPGSALVSGHGAQPVEDSTLGAEYYSNTGIGALLTEGLGTPLVEALFAGTNCFFR